MTTIEEQTVLFKHHLREFLHGTREEAAEIGATLTLTCTDEWTYRSLVVLFAATASTDLRRSAGPLAIIFPSFFVPVPRATRTPAGNHAAAIITAAANRDLDMLTALTSALNGPDIPNFRGTDSVLVQIGAMTRTLHQQRCGGRS